MAGEILESFCSKGHFTKTPHGRIFFGFMNDKQLLMWVAISMLMMAFMVMIFVAAIIALRAF